MPSSRYARVYCKERKRTLELGLAQRRGVASDQDELGLARTKGLQGRFVAEDDLAGLHHKRQLAVDVVSIGLGPRDRRMSVTVVVQVAPCLRPLPCWPRCCSRRGRESAYFLGAIVKLVTGNRRRWLWSVSCLLSKSSREEEVKNSVNAESQNSSVASTRKVGRFLIGYLGLVLCSGQIRASNPK
jgi:hypothetical protein